jgi:hypothetical protein
MNTKKKLAREQLGLKKDGEIVINFPAGGINSQPQDDANKHQSNPKKWWQYLFKNS